LFDAVGEQLFRKGQEIGASTGRNRRCGWFDAAAVKLAIRINSVSGICLTKLDVLDGLDTVKICTGYKGNNSSSMACLTNFDSYNTLEPIYEAFTRRPAAERAQLHQADRAVDRSTGGYHLHRA
jgi:adenylosuccinate synthase